MNKETKAKIADACLQQNWMTTAPVHIVVCGIEDLGKQFYGIRGERLYTLQNCAASIQNMLLAAKDLGLGTCWVGAFDERMLKEIVGIADNARPQAIITLGFPAEVPKIPNKEPLYNVYFIESYNGRIEDMDAALGFHGNVIRRELKKAGETAEKKGSKILSKLKEQGKEILKKAKRNK